MATDPKALVNATQQIQTHLERYEKRREIVSKAMQQAQQRMKTIDQIMHGTEGELNQLISDLAKERTIVEGCVTDVETVLHFAKDPAPEYEQVQRRYLDSKKTSQELTENWLEKKQAFEKNRTDQKAAMAFELAEKAWAKADYDVSQLKLAAEGMVNFAQMRSAERLVTSLPDLLHRYEEALKNLMTALGAEQEVRSLSVLLKQAMKH